MLEFEILQELESNTEILEIIKEYVSRIIAQILNVQELTDRNL